MSRIPCISYLCEMSRTLDIFVRILCFFCFFLISACGAPPAPASKAAETKAASAAEEPADQKKKLIVFFGNSLTAAYGLEREEGFTSLLQEKIDQVDKPYRTVNAGNSGETTAGGLSRIDWILDRNALDIFVLELGGNDGLRGVAPESSYENLKQIVAKVRAKYPDCKIILAGMQAPPNMGQSYTTAFQAIFPRLAKAENLALIPFLLEGVAGIPSLNQADRIHPTAEGHKLLAENIWEILAPML